MSTTTPFDNVLRYHVQSRTRPQVKHLVDLELYGGNGACSCEHFTFKMEPHLKRGARSETGGLRCWHIQQARDRLADDVVSRAAGQLNGKPPMKRITRDRMLTAEEAARNSDVIRKVAREFHVGGPTPRKRAGAKRRGKVK
jgi:hypothetical protein